MQQYIIHLYLKCTSRYNSDEFYALCIRMCFNNYLNSLQLNYNAIKLMTGRNLKKNICKHVAKKFKKISKRNLPNVGMGG